MMNELAELIDRSNRIALFTGAGISTESGIPDFRSPTGIWTRMKPIQFQDFLASEEIRQESWRRRFSGDRILETAVPNKGHLAVAELIRRGKALAVITQNIDNLHQNSGVPPEQVIELHGNATFAKCLSCSQRYEMSTLEEQFNRAGTIAPCPHCGGIIKSATISFGQGMPDIEMARAQEVTEACDLFMVLGSSLVVYPAAGFPELAYRLGTPLVIINQEPTPLDDMAVLVIHHQIGPTLAFVTGIN